MDEQPAAQGDCDDSELAAAAQEDEESDAPSLEREEVRNEKMCALDSRGFIVKLVVSFIAMS